MPKCDFYVGSFPTKGAISFEVDRITGTGGAEYPRLTVPLEVSMSASADEKVILTYTILDLRVTLATTQGAKIGEGSSDPLAAYSSPSGDSRSFTVEIPLDHYRLERISEAQVGDVTFQLSGVALVALHSRIPKAVPGQNQQFFSPVEQFTTGSFVVAFTVPHSHWVNKILPGVGYGDVRLIEIPAPVLSGLDTFPMARKELVQSESYFRRGDYDKAVEHCRNSLEAFSKALPELKKLLTNSKFEWLKELCEGTYDWIDRVYKKTRDITAIPHHAPSVGHFSRFEAQTIFLVTTALLSYSAKILDK